jgi:hypothetical protein
MIYFCCDELRRQLVREHPTLNGIDFLEVLDGPDVAAGERQRKLYVHFLKEDRLAELDTDNILIQGGERIRDVAVVSAQVDGDDTYVLDVEVNQPGDFSTYTLRLVQDRDELQPPEGFDLLLAAVDFSFKVGCPSDFDCRAERICPPEPLPAPEIDYLAKDYASFRQLMLDRLAVLLPEWQERHAADLGVALVELLAYVADHLSYQQDAVATEAYLGTARRRASVRRHARLVDYFMHDGCNARAWVQVQVEGSNVPLARGTQLFTRVAGLGPRIPPDSRAHDQAMAARPEAFATMHDSTLFAAHNEMRFYTWGARECCIPAGATKATLRDDEENRLLLRPGDVLVFEERFDPRTGREADADPNHRHAVRLTRVSPEAEIDAEGRRTAGALVTDPLFVDPIQPIVEIEWGAEDALPFPVCISAIADGEQGPEYVEDVSVTLGNVVLADHGLAVGDEPLGTVPEPVLLWPPARDGDRCVRPQREPVPPRFRPHLQRRPLTQAAPDPFAGDRPGRPVPASVAMLSLPHQVLPAIILNTVAQEPEPPWHPRRDLLNSGPGDHHFVVEVEADGLATLRFGDDRFGERPNAGAQFTASYRVGNGLQGNVGAGAVAHVVSSDSGITGVRNPLPARGGTGMEGIEDVRQSAPAAFRTQERAVTPADYAEVTRRHAGVQRAAATFRWTGSWHTVFVTADRWGGLPVDGAFEEGLRGHLERYRMAGHDLEIDAPRFVPLEIELQVCARPDYFRSDVKAALLEVFGNRLLPDGRRGVFHPDHFSFGQPVYLSRLYAAALAVEGVASVQVSKFCRWDAPGDEALKDGVLALERLEIARLDNDPNYPEHGVLRVMVEGGK